MTDRSRPVVVDGDDHGGATAAAGGATTVQSVRYVLGTISLVAMSALLALVLWASVLAIAPGWMQHALSSDSMRPSIQRGDVVLTSPALDGTLDPPRVVAFTDLSHGDHVVHRIVDRNDDGTFVTRGDANASPDSTPLDPERVEGVGRILVPWVGFPAVWMTEGRVGLVGGAAALVLLLGWGSRFALLDRFDPWLPAEAPTQRSRARERRRTIGAVLPSVLIMLAGPALGAFVAHAASGATWATGYWLDTPENLTLTGAARTSLNLAWDPVSNADEYILRWSEDGVGWSETLPTTVPEGSVDGLEPDTTYEVQVQASNPNVASEWSASVTATTDPITYVFTASIDTNSHTLDTLDGSVQGTAYTTHGNQIYGVAVDAAGNVYTADTGGRVIKRSPDGTVLWNVTPGNGVNGVAVDATGFVYTAGTDGRVRKLRPADGSVAWVVRPTSNAAYGIAVDADGFVYVGASDRYVRKLDSNGTEVWNRREHTAGVYEVAVDAAGNVYSASDDNTIRSRSSAGVAGWTFTGHTGTTTYGVAVDGQGNVYSTGDDGTVRKLSAATGTQQWSYPSGATTVYGVAVDSKGNVYAAGGDGTVHKISPAGGQVWVEQAHAVTQPVIRVAVDPGAFTVAGHGGGSTVSAFSSTAGLDPLVDADDTEDTDEASALDEPSDAEAPSVPADLAPPGDPTVGETTATSVELTWSAVDEAQDYEVRLLTGEQDTWSQGPTTAETSVIVEDLDPATHHDLQVRARDGERTSDWSDSVVATTGEAPESPETPEAYAEDEPEGNDGPPADPDPLAAPEGLTVVDTASTAVELAWDAVDGAEEYEVAWSVREQDTWSEGVAAEASWTIEGLDPETTYDLRVRAVGADEAGPWSASVVATTGRLSPPTEVVVTGVSSVTVDLAWGAVAAADGYRVRWREVGTETWLESDLTATVAVTVEGLDPETAYELEVRAERGGAVSDWSATATALTAPADAPADAASSGPAVLAATEPRQTRRRVRCRR